MTVKQFFKSITFRCILVLLAIALVSGGLLSVLNDVLAVSEEEKLQRVISSLYSDPTVSAEELELTDDLASNDYGTVNKVYVLSDGNMIVNATGGQGYKNGTVTVWAIATFDGGDFTGIQKASVDSYDKQTLMSQLGKKFLDVFGANNDKILAGEYFTTGTDGISSVSTGATYSSVATNNAVNAVIAFAKEYVLEVQA